MSITTYLVEDNQSILDNLTKTLQELVPVRVVAHADNQAQASLWLDNHDAQWQLAIVDLFLREGSGLGVLANCHKLQHQQKIVVFTNYATPEIRRRALELGADQVFDKSIDLDLLLAYCTDLHEELKKPTAAISADSQQS